MRKIPYLMLAIALMAYFTMGYINELIAENQVVREMKRPPLFDRGHNILPQYPQVYADGMMIAFVLYFLCRWAIKYPNTLVNYLWIIAILFIGRVITFSMTHVPPPKPGCSTIEHGEKIHYRVFRKGWKECLDMMYSGHTIHIVLVCMFTLYLSQFVAEKIAVVILTIVSICFIVGSRMHYTGDVLIATIITILVFFAWPGIDQIFKNIKHGGIYGSSLKRML